MANLIGFDKNRDNLQFKGHCKLSINFMSRYLFVEPKNKEFKLISASFKWNFVINKNLLFVFAEFNFFDFCLEFKNEQICKKILDYINSGKNDITEIPGPLSIDNYFLNPLLKKIADNPPLNSDLIGVMAKWLPLLDEADKEKYANLMKEYGIFDLISASIRNQASQRKEPNLERRSNRKRKLCQTKAEERSESLMEKGVAFQTPKIILSSQFQLLHILKVRKRTLLIFCSEKMDSFHEYQSKLGCDIFKCITCEHKAILDKENVEFCVKMESKKHLCKPLKKLPKNSAKIKIFQKPDYELLENCTGKVKTVLIVFDSDERSHCYEYLWDKSNSLFYCRDCRYKKIAFSQISKAKIRNEGSEKEYIEVINDHQCEKRKYQPETFHQYFDCIFMPDFEIQKCNYNGKERQRLIILDSSNRTKC